MTDRVMLALINRSSRNAGIGVIIAMTIPRTTKGTERSRQGTLLRPWPGAEGDLAESACLAFFLSAAGGASRLGGGEFDIAREAGGGGGPLGSGSRVREERVAWRGYTPA